jgi:hypothetical protein
VRVILVPPDEQTALWLDPVEPVVLVGFASLQLKPDLNPRGRHRVLVGIKQLAWIYLRDDPVRAGFTRFSTSPSNVVELTAESVPDAVVKPLAL